MILPDLESCSINNWRQASTRFASIWFGGCLWCWLDSVGRLVNSYRTYYWWHWRHWRLLWLSLAKNIAMRLGMHTSVFHILPSPWRYSCHTKTCIHVVFIALPVFDWIVFEWYLSGFNVFLCSSFFLWWLFRPAVYTGASYCRSNTWENPRNHWSPSRSRCNTCEKEPNIDVNSPHPVNDNVSYGDIRK